MSDLFARQRLQLLTGLTKFTQLTGVSTDLTSGAWTTIHPATVAALTEHLVINAYKVSLTGTYTNPLFRITATKDIADISQDASKIFPYGVSTELISGVDALLQNPVQIPADYNWALQVKVTGTDCTATLDYLSAILIPHYTYE